LGRGGRPKGTAILEVTIVVDAESAPLEQIVGQLDKLVNVVAITTSLRVTRFERELLLGVAHG